MIYSVYVCDSCGETQEVKTQEDAERARTWAMVSSSFPGQSFPSDVHICPACQHGAIPFATLRGQKEEKK